MGQPLDQADLVIIGYLLNTWRNENEQTQSFGNITRRARVLASEWFQETHVRTTGFFDSTVPSYSEKDFRANFRLTRTSVEELWNKLAENQVREPNTSGRPSIPLLKSILITLWTLGTQDSYRSIADRFDVSKSTVYFVLDQIRTQVIQFLAKSIRMPTGNQKTIMAKEFEQGNLLPGVIGAIDGSFIQIPAPGEDQESYYNRKKYHAIILQAVCGPDMTFLDCNIGWPGSVHDSRVLHNSLLYQRAATTFSPHFYLLGDAAYPIRSWLMVPYKNTGKLTVDQIKFNTVLSKMRVVVEQAFALLKGRFRRLKCLELRDPIKLNQTILMCCILHNICLSETDLDDLLDADDDDEDEEELPDEDFDEQSKSEGEAKRKWLTTYISNTPNV